MNVYDFDKTIYAGDSTRDFFLFCLKKNPILLLKLPYQFYWAGVYSLHLIPKKKFKEKFFVFLKSLKCHENTVLQFWDDNFKKINVWYFEQMHPSDIIISASPSFLINEIGKRLCRLEVIATNMDPSTGRIEGENCYGEEKVKRFFEKYPDTVPDNFYSDSSSDVPFARISRNAYLVKKKEIKMWDVR